MNIFITILGIIAIIELGIILYYLFTNYNISFEIDELKKDTEEWKRVAIKYYKLYMVNNKKSNISYKEGEAEDAFDEVKHIFAKEAIRRSNSIEDIYLFARKAFISGYKVKAKE